MQLAGVSGGGFAYPADPVGRLLPDLLGLPFDIAYLAGPPGRLLPDLLGLAVSGVADRVGHLPRLLLYRGRLLISLRQEPLGQPARLPPRRPLAGRWVVGGTGLPPTAAAGPGIGRGRRERCRGPGPTWCPVRCSAWGGLRRAATGSRRAPDVTTGRSAGVILTQLPARVTAAGGLAREAISGLILRIRPAGLIWGAGVGPAPQVTFGGPGGLIPAPGP